MGNGSGEAIAQSGSNGKKRVHTNSGNGNQDDCGQGTFLDSLGAIKILFSGIENMPLKKRVWAINTIREMLHELSPFSSEPVDFVKWVPGESVVANDYNPNAVAPPEMELLRHSIMQDGYTQPIVGYPHDEIVEVVDGFHRNRVGKECKDVYKRVHGYLPVACIKPEREDRNDRIASTIRHNRARGKHKIDAMSDIVVELKRRNWSNTRICKELGMDEDEVLRLCQITGLEELFSDKEFSRAWDVEGSITPEDFEELTDDISTYGDELSEFRKVPSAREGRIFHTFEDWECYKAGFYNTTVPGKTKDECEYLYAEFLKDDRAFRSALEVIIVEWRSSCEHYLTNPAMNRIAWLGQAAACYWKGLPSTYRGGFSLLTEKEQNRANETALEYLNRWLKNNYMKEVTMDEANSGRQADLY